MIQDQDTSAVLKERFAQLPKVVQNAITSADVQKHLRELANKNKLHLDQWGKLENEVMMTLFGVTPVDELLPNIKKHVGVSDEMATQLANEISKIVFEPIREELERELEHPDAKAAEVSGVERAREQGLASELPASSFEVAGDAQKASQPAPAVLPATPPTPPLTDKIARAPISAAYKAGEVSVVRKSIEDDPYREPPA